MAASNHDGNGAEIDVEAELANLMTADGILSVPASPHAPNYRAHAETRPPGTQQRRETSPRAVSRTPPGVAGGPR